MKQSQGFEFKALQVLQKVYKLNHPEDPTCEGFKVQRLVDDQESLDDSPIDNSSNPFLALWSQTKLMFSMEYLRTTLLVCLVQMLLFGSCHGLYMFFPEIVDKIETFSQDSSNNKSTICQTVVAEEKMEEFVYHYLDFGDSNLDSTCSDKIEVATFGHSLALEMLYMGGFLVITLVINRVSKLSILLVILFGCGLSGFASLFVTTPLVQIYLYVGFMLTFLGVNIVCAATCNLFPTKLRGIAINVSMMFGRIGSVISTFIVGITLDQHCEMTFAVSAALMIVCGVLCAFIPQIGEVDGKVKKVQSGT